MANLKLGLFVYLGSLVALQTPANATDETPPKPIYSPGAWIGAGDYPIESLLMKSQGMVKFQLDIDGAGKVTKCAVLSSSGDGFLDDKACEMVGKRAKFDPARDANGAAIPGIYSNSVRWQLPDSNADDLQSSPDTASFTDQTSVISIRLNAAGIASPCMSITNPYTASEDIILCGMHTPELVSHYLQSPGYKAKSEIKFRRLVQAKSRLTSDTAAASFPFRKIFARADVSITPQGDVADCTASQQNGSFAEHDLCQILRSKSQRFSVDPTTTENRNFEVIFDVLAR